jgi:hypothetical protein
VGLQTDMDVAGIDVHIGQWVSSLAQPSEVLASRIVLDVMVGSGPSTEINWLTAKRVSQFAGSVARTEGR